MSDESFNFDQSECHHHPLAFGLLTFVLYSLSVLVPFGIIFLGIELAIYIKPTHVPDSADGVRLAAALIYAALLIGSVIAFARVPLRKLFTAHGFTYPNSDQAWRLAIVTLVFNGLVHIIDRIGGHVAIWLSVPGNVALACMAGLLFGFYYVENHTNGHHTIRRLKGFLLFTGTAFGAPWFAEHHFNMYAELYLTDFLELIGSLITGAPTH